MKPERALDSLLLVKLLADDREERWELRALAEGVALLLDYQRHNTVALGNVQTKVGNLMADLSGLQAEASTISASITAAVTALNDLAARVGQGDGVSQADVDAITATLTGAQSSLDSAVATDSAPADPAPVETATGE